MTRKIEFFTIFLIVRHFLNSCTRVSMLQAVLYDHIRMGLSSGWGHGQLPGLPDGAVFRMGKGPMGYIRYFGSPWGSATSIRKIKKLTRILDNHL